MAMAYSSVSNEFRLLAIVKPVIVPTPDIVTYSLVVPKTRAGLSASRVEPVITTGPELVANVRVL